MRVVQKFGGSSVADAASIKRVAQRIVDTKARGAEVVVVISAMGDTTDELITLAKQVTSATRSREMDMLLATGEQVSIALLAMAFADLGCPAVSLTGPQAGIRTNSVHMKGRICDMNPDRVFEELSRGNIVVVAGFQGVSPNGDVTTLGRGGSDTTAVALAAALDADVCEIYTDVDGVYTADPRIVKGARQVPRISYDEMLELAACGAKILHLRCVEYARREGVTVHVRSSFSNKPGTLVTGLVDMQKGNAMEEAIISGIAHDRGEAKVTVAGVPDQVGVAAMIFEVIAECDVNIDMIVQNVSEVATGATDITFTVPMSDGKKAVDALNAAKDRIGFTELRYDDQIGKVSVVGVGMRTHPGVTAKFFGALAAANINIQMISTSEIRISVVVDAGDVDAAVQAAHSAFELDAAEEAIVYAGTGR